MIFESTAPDTDSYSQSSFNSSPLLPDPEETCFLNLSSCVNVLVSTKEKMSGKLLWDQACSGSDEGAWRLFDLWMKRVSEVFDIMPFLNVTISVHHEWWSIKKDWRMAVQEHLWVSVVDIITHLPLAGVDSGCSAGGHSGCVKTSQSIIDFSVQLHWCLQWDV